MRKLEDRVDARVRRWFGHMVRMDDGRLVKRVMDDGRLVKRGDGIGGEW